jgi:hypothetical protein
MWRVIIFLSFIVTFIPELQAETDELGSSPRALGLGKALTAHPTGGEACFFNPAGLSNLNCGEVLFTRTFSSPIYRCDTLSLGIKKGEKLSFGSAILRLKVDDIFYTKATTLRELPSIEEISRRGITEFFTLISLAHKLEEFFSLGATLKLTYKNFMKLATGFGISLDIGFLFHLNRFSTGVNIQDALETSLWFYSPEYSHWYSQIYTGGKLPAGGYEFYSPRRREIRIRIGTCYSLPLKESEVIFLTNFDTPGSRLKELLARAGIEWKLFKMINLRLGYQFLGEYFNRIGDNLSLGIGVSYRNWSVDYAYSSYLPGARIQAISLKITFGKEIETRRE